MFALLIMFGQRPFIDCIEKLDRAFAAGIWSWLGRNINVFSPVVTNCEKANILQSPRRSQSRTTDDKQTTVEAAVR
jgi:hypothetical protein